MNIVSSVNKTLLACHEHIFSRIACVSFSTSTCNFGRKTRIPYDKRFPISPKDVGPSKTWGKQELSEKYGRAYGRPEAPGYYDDKNVFHKVPEMTPEFVVPDLTSFRLKPYVSYRVPEVTQSEFTAKNLFDAVYSENIIKDFKKGKLKDPKSYISKISED